MAEHRGDSPPAARRHLAGCCERIDRFDRRRDAFVRLAQRRKRHRRASRPRRQPRPGVLRRRNRPRDRRPAGHGAGLRPRGSRATTCSAAGTRGARAARPWLGRPAAAGREPLRAAPRGRRGPDRIDARRPEGHGERRDDEEARRRCPGGPLPGRPLHRAPAPGGAPRDAAPPHTRSLRHLPRLQRGTRERPSPPRGAGRQEAAGEDPGSRSVQRRRLVRDDLVDRGSLRRDVDASVQRSRARVGPSPSSHRDGARRAQLPREGEKLARCPAPVTTPVLRRFGPISGTNPVAARRHEASTGLTDLARGVGPMQSRTSASLHQLPTSRRAVGRPPAGRVTEGPLRPRGRLLRHAGHQHGDRVESRHRAARA